MPHVELSTGPSFQGGRTSTSTQRCSLRQDSDLIQIACRDASMWRGKLWSAITFKIKIDNSFVRTAAEGAPYTLRPVIVDAKTRKGYRPGCGMVKLRFGKNNINLDTAVAAVTKDPHNTIEAEFHQDLFEHGDSFNLVVEASRRDDNEVVFGVSPTIRVTNFSLAIEEGFVQHPHVSRVADNEFAWYCKCGGDKASLSVTFHLKNEKGRVINASDVPMKLKTELVYTNGSPAPLMPLAPLKQRRSAHLSTKALYRPLVSDPIIQPGQGSRPFSFRIEEVSHHHREHGGFKLKVSPADPTQHFVHPGLLEETIIVLSKPKHDSTKTKKQGGRSITALSNLDATDLAPKPTKVRKVSNVSIALKSTKVRKVSNGSLGAATCSTEGQWDLSANVTVPTSGLLKMGRLGGKCRFCSKKIGATDFLRHESHDGSCLFSAKLLAPTKIKASQSNVKLEGRTQPPVDFTFTTPKRSVYDVPSLIRAAAADRGVHSPIQFMGQSVVSRHPGASLSPAFDLALPREVSDYRAVIATDVFSKSTETTYGAAPMVAPVQVGSGTLVPGFWSSSSCVDPLNNTIVNGSDDDGGMNALAYPIESREDEKYYSATEEEEEDHRFYTHTPRIASV